jgi:hypothetical protein
MNRAENSMESLIERYIREKLDTGVFSLSEAATHWLHLMGSPDPFQYLGFVRFLKGQGLERPTYWEISEYWITEYNEFLFQHVGELNRQAALESLKQLWAWAAQHYPVRHAREPIVFYYDKARPSFRITVKIAEYEEGADLRS